MTDSPELAFAETKIAAERLLSNSNSVKLEDTLLRQGYVDTQLGNLTLGVTEDTTTHAQPIALAERLNYRHAQDKAGELMRWVLARHFSAHGDRIWSIPAAAEAKTLTIRYIGAVIDGSVPLTDTRLTAGHPHFGATCRAFRYERLLGDEFDWDTSGLSRSIAAELTLKDTILAGYHTIFRARGYRPMFYFHLGLNRSTKHLTPEGTMRSFRMIAESLELNPSIRGCIAAPWWCAKQVPLVTPSLAWFRSFLEVGGAFIADYKSIDPHCGALARSATRRQLYDAGEYEPRRALVLWPRSAMLKWARERR